MALGTSVEQVLQLVEEATGVPVYIEADSNLPRNILAQLTPAGGDMPFHRVAYQADRSSSPDYLIVYQCGFLLRHYAVPTKDRVEFAITDMAEQTVRQWVRNDPSTPGLAENTVGSLTSLLFKGILNQLRSIPVGLRVDSWILEDYPDLAPFQREAAMKQLDDNAAGLRPDEQGTMPERALAASLAMSAAFASYWVEKLGQPQITLPYRATGYLAAGQALIDLWRSIPDDPASDKRLIDAWAVWLGLQGWYQWVSSKPGH
jgi:hypothetical protein